MTHPDDELVEKVAMAICRGRWAEPSEPAVTADYYDHSDIYHNQARAAIAAVLEDMYATWVTFEDEERPLLWQHSIKQYAEDNSIPLNQKER